MDSSLRDRLRKLGVQKGTAHLKMPHLKMPASPTQLDAPAENDAIDEIGIPPLPSTPLNDRHFALALWNIEQPTTFGTAYINRSIFHLDHIHGDRALGKVLHAPLHNHDFAHALFLDTETTGLSGGAGTLAFLVGVGYFVNAGHRLSHFVVDQFFLHDPAAEPAMLVCIDKLVNEYSSLVTFNGKAFDIPLLESRFIVSRIAPSFADKVHLDLLHISRQAWRNTLSSHRLGSLEFHMLGVRRDQQDIAGFLIPQLYRDYLNLKSPATHADMSRVMYHNLYDILSMVTLAVRLHEVYEQPQSASDHLAVARLRMKSGDTANAISAYKKALGDVQLQASQNDDARRNMANTLKRLGRYDEAVEHWQALADNDDLIALIELAKYYEWRKIDYTHALLYARRALRFAPDSTLRYAIAHRIERIEKKIGSKAI